MASAFDAKTDKSLTTAGTSDSTTHTPAGTPTEAFVSLSFRDAVTNVAVTYGGQAMTAVFTGSSGKDYLFKKYGPLSGAQTVAVSWTTSSRLAWEIATYVGQTADLASLTTFDSTATADTRTVLSVGTNDLVVHIATSHNSDSWTGTGTERWDHRDGAGPQSTAGYDTTGSGSVNVTATPSGGLTAFTHVAFRLPAGNQYTQAVAGGITPTGSLVRKAKKSLSGGFTPSGALVRKITRALGGGFTPAGGLAKKTKRALDGSAASSGALTKKSKKALGGTVTLSGSLSALAQTAAKQLAAFIMGIVRPTRNIFGWPDPTAHIEGTLDPGYSELMLNPGFELTGAAPELFGPNWTLKTDSSPDSDIGIETVNVYSGGVACRLQNTVSGTVYAYQIRPVTAGSTYRLSCMARGDGSVSGRYAIYDYTNAVDIVAFASTLGVAGTNYKHFSYDFVAPAGCAQVQVSFAAPASVGTAYVDDTSLVLLPLTTGAIARNVDGKVDPIGNVEVNLDPTGNISKK